MVLCIVAGYICSTKSSSRVSVPLEPTPPRFWARNSLNDELCRKVIKDELIEIKTKYGDERRSEIVYSSEEFNPEDFYADKQSAFGFPHTRHGVGPA